MTTLRMANLFGREREARTLSLRPGSTGGVRRRAGPVRGRACTLRYVRLTSSQAGRIPVLSRREGGGAVQPIDKRLVQLRAPLRVGEP